MTKEITIKIHTHPKGKIVAMCDKEHLNQIYQEGKITLDLKKHNEFYNGETISLEEAKNKLEENINEIKSINAIGKKCINILKQVGYNVPVNKIQDVEHVQIYKL